MDATYSSLTMISRDELTEPWRARGNASAFPTKAIIACCCFESDTFVDRN